MDASACAMTFRHCVTTTLLVVRIRPPHADGGRVACHAPETAVACAEAHPSDLGTLRADEVAASSVQDIITSSRGGSRSPSADGLSLHAPT